MGVEFELGSKVSGFRVVLTRVRKLSESTRDFRFQRDDGEAVVYEPGQFFRFVFEDENGEFERSYSLCNFSDEQRPNDLDLVISTVTDGRASKLLFSTEVGLEARVTGPFGRLVLPKKLPMRLFLVATSVGVAPYMPMLRQLANEAMKQGSLEVHLLYGIRDYREFIYGDQLLQWEAEHLGFHLHLSVSQCEVDTSKARSQNKGYVQAMLMDLKPNPETDHVMLCGNPKMIDEAYPLLKQIGFGVKQVVREKYVFAKDKKAVTTSMSDEQRALIAEKMKKYKKP